MRLANILVRIAAVVTLALVGTCALAGPPGPTVCSNATLAAGIHKGLKVTGHCVVDSAVVVDGDVNVEDGAYLDAAYGGTRLVVDGDVKVGKGAKLALGCTFYFHAASCGFDPVWMGAVVVNGNIAARNALTMYIDYTIVHGNVEWKGGGDASMVDHPPAEDGLVLAIKDNVIGGNLKVDGWAGAWFGAIRNTVSGNVDIRNTAGTRLDPGSGIPDSTEVVSNVVAGNLKCEHNTPPAQIGDSLGSPNVVLGKKSGECAGI